ncbi:MAG: plasmid pRiA4b ORF-3 family protein, partial [Bacilli bacterium]|nr:plasmid pRiA4b ORF-3 family protein [Bacilli bacterium]
DELDFENDEEYYEIAIDCINSTMQCDDDDPRSQPFVYPVAHSMYYSYDFGDGWRFKITNTNAKELLEKRRVSVAELKNAVKQVWVTARPYLLAADGLPLVEDVGGVHGYLDFLKGEGMYEDKEESLEWAEGQGWENKIPGGKSFF